MSRKFRKQRVALRFKRREQLKGRLRTVLVRSVVVALVVGFGVGLVTGGNSFLPRFVRRHTPMVDLSAPRPLVGLPLLEKAPQNLFWLWFPGSGLWLEYRIRRAYPAVRAVHIERHAVENRIILQPEPRIPLVAWNGSGFDREGVLFAMTPGTWDGLPQASFLPSAGKQDLCRWLGRMSGIPELWPQVQSIRQTPDETFELTLRTGTVVVWGSLDDELLTRKAQTLARVLDDAHKNMGGAARADLRFFDQGRIIVRLKGR